MAKKGKIKKVFPGSNTARGFHSFYDHIIEPDANKVFIVKGGPGVGKSTFMRRIGEDLVARGFDVEFHCCSSDNDSLDGVVIPALGTALIDGTAPHVFDPRNPGAVDEIIHLGDHWNEDALRARREEILAANKEVGTLFARAYNQLKEAKVAHDELESYHTAATDFPAVNARTDEIIDELFGTNRRRLRVAKQRHLFASAITPDGPVHYIDTVIRPLKKRFILRGDPGTGKTTLVQKVARAAIDKGYDVEIYHCGFDPDRTDMVVIPELGAVVANGAEPHVVEPTREADRVVDFREYVRWGQLQECRTDIAEARERYERVFQKAVSNLRRAKLAHDRMQDYYVPNIDFAAVEERRKKVLGRIIELGNAWNNRQHRV